MPGSSRQEKFEIYYDNKNNSLTPLTPLILIFFLYLATTVGPCPYGAFVPFIQPN